MHLTYFNCTLRFSHTFVLLDCSWLKWSRCAEHTLCAGWRDKVGDNIMLMFCFRTMIVLCLQPFMIYDTITLNYDWRNTFETVIEGYRNSHWRVSKQSLKDYKTVMNEHWRVVKWVQNAYSCMLRTFVAWEAILSKAPTTDYSQYQFGNACITQAILTFSRKWPTTKQQNQPISIEKVFTVLTMHTVCSFMCSVFEQEPTAKNKNKQHRSKVFRLRRKLH